MPDIYLLRLYITEMFLLRLNTSHVKLYSYEDKSVSPLVERLPPVFQGCSSASESKE